MFEWARVQATPAWIMHHALIANFQLRRLLVCILAGCLDDGRPAIDFTFQRALGIFWCGFILRHRSRVDLIESPHKIRIFECRLERGGELLDDGGRRPLGCKHPMPYSQLEAFQSGFIGGGKRRQRG
jgi:hypothetical protein